MRVAFLVSSGCGFSESSTRNSTTVTDTTRVCRQEGYISDPQGEGVTGQCVMGLVPCSSDSYTWGHDAHGCSKGGWVTAGLSVPCSIWYVAQLRGKEQTENHF